MLLTDHSADTTPEVFVRRDPNTGVVILSSKLDDWEGFFALLAGAEVPSDFLDKGERRQGGQERDPCDGWQVLIPGKSH